MIYSIISVIYNDNTYCIEWWYLTIYKYNYVMELLTIYFKTIYTPNHVLLVRTYNIYIYLYIYYSIILLTIT